MNVNINLPDHLEHSLRSKAAASGLDVAGVMERLIADWLQGEEGDLPPNASAAEFERRLDAWIRLHPQLPHTVDDSRESIYAGRGE